jgi:hypothetical protein
MTKIIRHYGFTAGLVVAVLCAAQPAAADTIELNNFWAGSGSVSINFNGIDWHDGSSVTENVSGGSGGFKTYDLTTDPNRANAFQSFCVDIFHSFNFVVDSSDVLKPADIALAGTTATAPTPFSSQAAIDLGRLFTKYHNYIDSTSSSGTNESAFQLAVWEIVNDRSGSYSLAGGDFKATGTGSSLANQWLADLGNASDYTANIWTVQKMISGRGYAQDVVVFAPVPEPQTYAMLLAGLGIIGFTLRRRKQQL